MRIYLHSKAVPEFSRCGQIVADRQAHAVIASAAPRAYQAKDANTNAKAMEAAREALRERGYFHELVYDAAHGRRYLMVAFMPSGAADPDTRIRENKGARNMAFDFLCAPESTFYESPEA